MILAAVDVPFHHRHIIQHHSLSESLAQHPITDWYSVQCRRMHQSRPRDGSSQLWSRSRRSGTRSAVVAVRGALSWYSCVKTYPRRVTNQEIKSKHTHTHTHTHTLAASLKIVRIIQLLHTDIQLNRAIFFFATQLPADRLGVKLPFSDAATLTAAISKHSAEAHNVTVCCVIMHCPTHTHTHTHTHRGIHAIIGIAIIQLELAKSYKLWSDDVVNERLITSVMTSDVRMHSLRVCRSRSTGATRHTCRQFPTPRVQS